MSKHSGSLNTQINALEMQIMSRHRNIRTAAAGFNRKITARMVSPGALLAAFGIGVAIEQTSHQRGWSMATAVDAASASIRLLLSFSSSLQSVSENATQASTHDSTRQ